MHDKKQFLISNTIVNTFVESFIDYFRLERILFLDNADYNLFSEVPRINDAIHMKTISSPVEQQDMDLVVGNTIFSGTQLEEVYINDKKIHIRLGLSTILYSLPAISKNGYGLFVVGPEILYSRKGEDFKSLLHDRGFSIHAIFQAPEKAFKSYMSLRPLLIVIARDIHKEIFIAELGSTEQARSVIQNFDQQNNLMNLETGLFVDAKSFVSFSSYKASQQITILMEQYSQYISYRLCDISDDIHFSGNQRRFEAQPNSIYIHRSIHKPVVTTVEQEKSHDHYIQVVLDRSVVIDTYLVLFFTSKMGVLLREFVSVGTTIPLIKKSLLEEIEIPVPSILEQEIIIAAHKKLTEIQTSLTLIEEELAVNLTSAHTVHISLDALIDALKIVTNADRIRHHIRQGESQTCEFKQTLSLNIRNTNASSQKKDTDLETSVYKTIVAFLNTQGGTLYIGVDDNGKICGIEDELYKFHGRSRDKFLLHFTNNFVERIGGNYSGYLQYDLVDIDNKPVLVVECTSSKEPCFLDGKDFYIRNNPDTRKLEGHFLLDYVNSHFKD